MSSEYPIVTISTQPIELCKLLKIANMVSGGGEAKIVISEGYVYLNGEAEFQKRKKIYANDIIEFNGDVIQVAYSPKEKSALLKKETTQSKVKNKTSSKNNNKQKSDIQTETFEVPTKNKRKPIAF